MTHLHLYLSDSCTCLMCKGQAFRQKSHVDLLELCRSLPGQIIFFFIETVENAFQVIVYKLMFICSPPERAVTLRRISRLIPWSRPEKEHLVSPVIEMIY